MKLLNIIDPAVNRTADGPMPRPPRLKERLETPHKRLPAWIKIRPKTDPNYERVRDLLKNHQTNTVCQEASCPNITECWGSGTATFMILGKNCTRSCKFCDVANATPDKLDPHEPKRLARVVGTLGLKQVVITMVSRDDLDDGGAGQMAQTVLQLREQDPDVKIELLVSDFAGKRESMKTVLEAGVDVMGHNVETVSRLHRRVRAKATLAGSLAVLRQIDEFRPRPVVKTGFMVGVGETTEEIIELFHQLREVGVDLVTVGQYLRPSLAHLPVERFYTPEEFENLARIGREIGFAHVEAGPLVRTSYKAFDQSKKLLEAKC